MLFENSQDSFDMNIAPDITRVGIKMSGGTDSTIVAYMVAKYCKQQRPDITIYPITGISEQKAYQAIFAKQVVQKIEQLLDYKFGPHSTAMCRSDENYVADQDTLVADTYKKYDLQMHFAGITANPTAEEAPELVDPTEFDSAWYNDRQKQETKLAYVWGPSTRPLINVDKKGVREHYVNQGVLEELFPLTRSCETHTTDFSEHCGDCWFCKERFWGFGRYV